MVIIGDGSGCMAAGEAAALEAAAGVAGLAGRVGGTLGAATAAPAGGETAPADGTADVVTADVAAPSLTGLGRLVLVGVG